MRLLTAPTLFATALALCASVALAQKVELTVYTALETDQLKAYEAGFRVAQPDISIKWVRDSTGVITAKLLAEKANPQADVVMGVAASSLALLDKNGMLEPVRAAEPRRDHEPVPRQEEPAGLVRHGRVGRHGVLQHRRRRQKRASPSPKPGRT